MKDKQKLYILLIILITAALIILCTLLWDTSETAAINSDGANAFPVYITEILASNTLYPNEVGLCCDYIELYNSADYAIKLSKYQLTDGSKGTRYSFPSDTILEPGEYIVVYCDKTASGRQYAKFGLSKLGGETISFLTPKGMVIMSVTTVQTLDNQSMLVSRDGSVSLSGIPTPGRSNDDVDICLPYVNNVQSVRINELMADNSAFPDADGNYNDWIELYNLTDSDVDLTGCCLTDDEKEDKFLFPGGSVIPANGYMIIYCGKDIISAGYAAPFGLSRFGREIIQLKNADGIIIDTVTIPELSENLSYALHDDNKWVISEQPSPGFENNDYGFECYMTSIGSGEHPIIISEIMASNRATIADADGNFSDWIELYNTTDETIDLEGWYISDNPDSPLKWSFPSCPIAPGEYKVLFCSKEGLANADMCVPFAISSSGETLTLTTKLGITSDSVRYPHQECDESFVFDKTIGEYKSSPFPTPGFENSESGYEKFVSSRLPTAELAIWEVMTSNDKYLTQSNGKCYDWVELCNISDHDINLSNYSISDSFSSTSKFVLPDIFLAPDEKYLVILSGDTSLSNAKYCNADFSLNAYEDRLYVFDKGNKVCDFVLIKDIPNLHTYGRTASDSGFFYMEPTPGQNNDDGYRFISTIPDCSLEAGVWIDDNPVDVSLSAAGTIYYTLDGSVPDKNSFEYSQSIIIDQTTILRAISLENGKMESDIFTLSVIISESHSIPIVSLVTDPECLNSIYKSRLEVKDIECPANISYTGSDGSFNIDCGISMHGATSLLAQPKKSFTVRFRNNYGGPLHYDIFEDGLITDFSSIILRADQESTYSSYIRDNLYGYIGTHYDGNMLAQNNKYVALYLNGRYWGIYSIREHYSEEMISSKLEVPLETVSMQKYYVLPGNSLRDVYDVCYDEKLTQSEYEYVSSVLDLESFADWIIFETYCGNFDINENMRYAYTSTDGKWRCGLVDVDLGMFRRRGFESVMDSLNHGTIVTALMNNDEFGDILCRRLAYLLSGPLSEENVIDTIDMLAGMIRDEIPAEKDRWGGTSKQWESMVASLKEYCVGRPEELIKSAVSILHLTSSEKEEYFGGIIT